MLSEMPGWWLVACLGFVCSCRSESARLAGADAGSRDVASDAAPIDARPAPGGAGAEDDAWLADASCGRPEASGCQRLPAGWCVADMLRQSGVAGATERELLRQHYGRAAPPDGPPSRYAVVGPPRDIAVLGWEVYDSPGRVERVQLWVALECSNGSPVWAFVDVFRSPGVPADNQWVFVYVPDWTPSPTFAERAVLRASA
jgi:hypothetical protein